MRTTKKRGSNALSKQSDRGDAARGNCLNVGDKWDRHLKACCQRDEFSVFVAKFPDLL